MLYCLCEGEVSLNHPVQLDTHPVQLDTHPVQSTGHNFEKDRGNAT